MNIKDMIKDNKKVHFVRYNKGFLYYKTEGNFEFPVPIEDTGDANFINTDKASYFMRWINKEIKVVKDYK